MDLLYYPLVFKNGIESSSLMEAFVSDAPTGAHRHRAYDLIAVLLSLHGDHRYSDDEVKNLVKTTADFFFNCQGSVTRAIQASFDLVNKTILDRNLDQEHEGCHAVGSINISVIHNDWLFIAQFGKMTTILISEDSYDEYGISEGQSEALGQSKRIQARFYQNEIKPGDLLLMSAKAPTTWNSYYLAGSAAITIPEVRQRLMIQVDKDLNAIVIKCSSGSGKVVNKNWVDEKQLIQDGEEKSKEVPLPDNFRAEILTSHEGDDQKSGNNEGDIQSEQTEPTSLVREETDFKELATNDQGVRVVAGETETPLSSNISALSESILDNKKSTFIIKLARAWMNLKTFNAKIYHSFERVRKQVFPNSQPSISPTMPLLSQILSVAIPVVLILVSVTVYSRTGKAEQYANLMEQAQKISLIARGNKNALQQHDQWAQVIGLIETAEQFNVTQESLQLHTEAQNVLDEMDLAARLDFRPALTEFFPDGVVINLVQANSSGVYLLDQTSGSILRIFLNTKGFYEIDDTFKCAPGPYGLETITNLIDFVILPANKENFRIMAVDSQGNLLYCRQGEMPASRKLVAPDNGWGRIIAAVYENDLLYVLDSEKDSVWMYSGKDPDRPDVVTAKGIVFSDKPTKFLDEDVPDLGGAIDFVVKQDDLFILHADGHMTHCRYSAEKSVRLTECQDPSPYTDNRVGRPDKKPWIITDAVFRSAQATTLPNTSIYLMDSKNQSIFQFSYQLNLERVLRAQYNKNYPIPTSSPSGFGISPDSELFLAFDNRLFISALE